MRYLLLLLLPLPCFGQFGGFRTDQPFLAKDSGTSFSLRDAPGLAYWWVAGDLSDGNVSVWTDRIQSVNLVQATAGKQPIKYDDSVTFGGLRWMEVTNTVSLQYEPPGHTLPYFMLTTTPLKGNRLDSMASVFMSSSIYNMVNVVGAIGTPHNIRNNLVTVWTTDSLKWLEFVYGGWGVNVYTNGVGPIEANPNPADTGGAEFKYVGRTFSGESSMAVCRVREIGIWTNYLDASGIEAIHRYVTNKYSTVSDGCVAKISGDFGVIDPYGAACTNGAKVATWKNKTGYGDFTQATGANQGYLVINGINGYPYVYFPPTNSASASGMDGLDILGYGDYSQPNVMFYVIRCHPQTGLATIFDSGNNTSRHAFTYDIANKRFQIYAGGAVNGPGTIATNTWYIVSAKFSGANSYIRTNGVLYVSGDVGTQMFYEGISLNHGTSPGDYVGKNNDVAEMRFYSADMSSNAVYSVESELATKYGITIP